MAMLEFGGLSLGGSFVTRSLLTTAESTSLVNPYSITVYNDRIYMTELNTDKLFQFKMVDGKPQVGHI